MGKVISNFFGEVKVENQLTLSDVKSFRALHLRRQQFEVKQCGGMTGLIISHATHGGLTVLYRRITDTVVQYAIARCSLEDRYVRKLGRWHAMRKLVSGKGQLMLLGDTAATLREKTVIQTLQDLIRKDKMLMRNLRVTQARSGGAK